MGGPDGRYPELIIEPYDLRRTRGPKWGAVVDQQVGQPNRVRSTSIAALVLGIVSLPTAFCLGLGLLPGIAAIVLARPGLRGPERGMALTGLVLGGVGVLLSVLVIVGFLIIRTVPFS